jgi:hypothetical protein
VLLAKEETVLQGMIERVIEIGRCCGISRQPFQIQIMTDQKQPENVEYFNYLGSMLTNDARCTWEIKSKIATAKTAFNKKKTLLTCKLGVNLRKKY